MPPLIIHRGERVAAGWKAGAPPGVEIQATRKGFVTDPVFKYWGNKFIAFLQDRGLLGRNHVLVLDGHGSHIYNYPFMKYMKRFKVEVACLEPHTTHATCPVDQSPFAELKKAYLSRLEAWCRDNKGKCLPKNQFFRVFWPAWVHGRSLKYIQAGFRLTGLYPVNRHAIPDHKFAPSAMVDEDTDTDSSDSESSKT